MVVCKTVSQLQEYRKSLGSDVGFIPTMGALHQGHMSLVKAAKKQNSTTIVSIYVNPTQFLAGEDLDRYPKSVEKDLQKCKDHGVDAVFLPSNLYGCDEVSIKAPTVRGYILEGHFRPKHFDGVLQVVLKLLNLTKPSHAYFGKKDAQQYLLIKQMVNDLFLDCKIVGCDTVRDSDGLAKSSRNSYLSQDARKRALTLSQALFFIQDRIASQDLLSLIEDAKKILDVDSLQYLCITDRKLQPIKNYEKDNTLITIAAYVCGTRLIDNLWI